MMPYNNYFQPYPQSMNMQAQAQAQIQPNGFISVRNENEAFGYPVAPGNCVTFKVEGQPIVIEKSMGFSQLEAPKIERYRLVKEDSLVSSQKAQIEPNREKPMENTIVDIKAEIEAIKGEIEDIKSKLEQPAKKRPQKEVKEDE